MHESVLLDLCIEKLNLDDDSIIIDCTLGYAGHSSLILKKIKKGYLYAFDQDVEAINYSFNKLNEIGSNFKIIKSNFKDIKLKLNELGVNEVDGILYDLGVSSPQLDNDYRGFSYHLDAKLDMRMDVSQKLSAYEVVNTYDFEKLVQILKEYGEEKYASNIVKAIIRNRPITTTLQLAEIVKQSVPFSYKKDKHPARKTFQAIRMEVNDEVNVLEKSLNDALNLIKINGRICVITFHSLEDRIVKRIFKKVSSIDNNLAKLPIIPDNYLPKYKIIGSFTPNNLEIINNNRSRSAKLTVIERIG